MFKQGTKEPAGSRELLVIVGGGLLRRSRRTGSGSRRTQTAGVEQGGGAGCHVGSLAAGRRSQRTQQRLRWTIQPLSHDEAVGTVGLLRVNHEHSRGELGYDLARRWWGQGLATEAAAAVVAYGFAVMELHRIEAGVLPGNDASVRVLQKLGFRNEGTLRDYIHLRGNFHNCQLFSLLATDTTMIGGHQ
jgi:hypothetical protein